MTGTSAWTQGAGIWSDTCDHATVTDNYTSDNYGPGLILEKNNSSTLSYNVSNNDDVVGTVNATDTCSVASLLVRVGESINGSGNQIYNNTVSGGWWGIANGDFYNCNGSDGSIAGNDIFRNNIAVNALSHNFFAGVGGNNNGTNGSGNIYDHNNFGAPGSTLAYWTGVGAISTYSALNAAYGSNMNNIQLNPLFVSTSTASMTVGEMQSLLVSLESQLQALETKAGITTNSSSYIFTRNLTIGSRGMDVQALQHYLNTHGFPVNSTLTYAGSLGYETQYFGTATQAALSAQRLRQLLPSSRRV